MSSIIEEFEFKMHKKSIKEDLEMIKAQCLRGAHSTFPDSSIPIYNIPQALSVWHRIWMDTHKIACEYLLILDDITSCTELQTIWKWIRMTNVTQKDIHDRRNQIIELFAYPSNKFMTGIFLLI